MGWLQQIRGYGVRSLGIALATLIGFTLALFAPTLGDVFLLAGAGGLIVVAVGAAVRRIRIRSAELTVGSMLVVLLAILDSTDAPFALVSAGFGGLALVGVTFHSRIWLPSTPGAFRQLVVFNALNVATVWFLVWAVAAQLDAYRPSLVVFAHVTAAACWLATGLMMGWRPPFRAFGSLLSLTLFGAAALIESVAVLGGGVPPESLVSALRILGFGAIIAPIASPDWGVPEVIPSQSLYRAVFFTLVAMLTPVAAVTSLSSESSRNAMPLITAGVVVALLGAVRLLSLVRETTRQFEIDLERAATDMLTGLPNRMWLQRQLERGSNRSSLQTVFSIVLSDLPEINRTEGYGVGDALLIESAARLRSLPDVADADLARIGDDQLAVVVDHPIDEVLAIADAIIDALSEPLSSATGLVRSRVSVGVTASAAPDGIDGGTVLHWAERAARRAALSGGNQLEVYSLGMSPSHRRELGLDESDRNARLRRLLHPDE